GVAECRLSLHDAHRIDRATALRGRGLTEQLGAELSPRRFELVGIACGSAAPRDAGARAEIAHVPCVSAEAGRSEKAALDHTAVQGESATARLPAPAAGLERPAAPFDTSGGALTGDVGGQVGNPVVGRRCDISGVARGDAATAPLGAAESGLEGLP